MKHRLFALMFAAALTGLAATCQTTPPSATPRTATIVLTGVTTSGTVQLERINPTINVSAPITNGTAVLPVPAGAGILGINVHLDVAGYNHYDCVGAPASPTGNFTIVIPDGPCAALVATPPPFTPLPRRVANGQFFALADGTPTKVKGLDCYTCYQQFLDGGPDAVKAQFTQAACLNPPACFVRANTIRVFMMYDNDAGLGHFLPRLYGDRYWSSIAAFDRFAATYGLYVEHTIFADTNTGQQVIFPGGADDERAFASRMSATLMNGETNTMVEWVNEADQTANHLDILAELQPIPGVLTSHGSNGGMKQPVTPYFDYLTFHTNYAFEEVRKMSHDCWTLSATLPCETNEISKFNVVGEWTGQHPNPNMAYDGGLGCGLLNAGCTFHSVDGLKGRVLGPEAAATAFLFLQGMDMTPTSCQSAPYRNANANGDTSILLRDYWRGTDPACHAPIRNWPH